MIFFHTGVCRLVAFTSVIEARSRGQPQIDYCLNLYARLKATRAKRLPDRLRPDAFVPTFSVSGPARTARPDLWDYCLRKDGPIKPWPIAADGIALVCHSSAPPSTTSAVPVIHSASSLAKNSAIAAMSSGRPARAIG